VLFKLTNSDMLYIQDISNSELNIVFLKQKDEGTTRQIIICV